MLNNDHPFKTIQELRDWMTSLKNAHPITDEVLGRLSCQWHAKQILENYSQQELAIELMNGIPKLNTLEYLEDAMNIEYDNPDDTLLHSLEIQRVAAEMLHKPKVVKTIMEKIDELTWWDDH